MRKPPAPPPPDRRTLVAEARAGWPSRKGGARAVAARAAFARCVWNARGERRLPSPAALDAALTGLARADLDWICEFGPLGPLYFLPTTRWVKALATTVRELGARRVLEVAAGDGFLARCLAAAAPELEVHASDSGAWERPKARMSAAERQALRGVAVPGLGLGASVERLEARAAIAKFKPDLVLAAWLPPGPLLEKLVRARVAHVLEVGAAGGVTSGAWHWRWAHDFCEGPLETLARCRLDARPAVERHSRITLYFGARHPDHALEQVRPGDWLWQFRPKAARGRKR